MSQNNDFYEKNARFKAIIKHYAWKLSEPHFEGELWGFLWILLNTSFVIPHDGYIFRALRNKYIDELRKRRFTWVPIGDELAAEHRDVDAEIDLKNALCKLDDTEKDFVKKHFFDGITYTEMAASEKVSRQAKSKQGKRILKKLRYFFQGRLSCFAF